MFLNLFRHLFNVKGELGYQARSACLSSEQQTHMQATPLLLAKPPHSEYLQHRRRRGNDLQAMPNMLELTYCPNMVPAPVVLPNGNTLYVWGDDWPRH